MPRQPASRARGYLSRGALLALLVHVHLLVPAGVLIWVYGARQQAEREARLAQEIGIDFHEVAPADLPKDLPSIDPIADQLQQPPKPPEKEKQKKLREKPTELAQKKDAKQEPEIVVPPLPPMPESPPPPPPEERKGHEKIVDLNKEDKNEPPPPDAKYLAPTNNRAAEETNARDRTLEKTKPNEEPYQIPTAEKDKVAETEDQKSALGRKAPEITPHVDPEVAAAQREAARKSPLALRDPAPRAHELTPETADPSLPKAADGDIAMARNARGPAADPEKAPGKRVKLSLSQKDFEYLFGADAEAERRLAQKERSTRKGQVSQRLARVRAALENFIPEVKPGNTTDLNTRAAPFAAYIARMHRSIHKLWGFGQLEDWDDLAGSSPLNNSHLVTTLELVLNRDGTVDKVTPVRTSGYLPFDAAAIDVVYSAGPYPDPPREIRSPNGKIYVHWTFHRDERQCTPAYTQYFILADAPDRGGPVDRPDAAAPGRGPSTPGAAPPSTTGTATTGEGGPRRLRRFDDGRHRAGMQRLNEEVAAAEEHDGHSHAAAPQPAESQATVARATDPAARAVAERWFKALAKGDFAALAGMAVIPFKTSGREVGKREVLTAMLKDLMREGAGERSVQVFSAAGLRAAIGKLPPHVDDGSGSQLYALASSGRNDTLILILAQRGGTWKPVGLVRR